MNITVTVVIKKNCNSFRIVFWDVLPCEMTSVDNHFTLQYIPEDNSEHHTRRRENLKSHIIVIVYINRFMFNFCNLNVIEVGLVVPEIYKETIRWNDLQYFCFI
jgi:hypothetical protein